MNMDQRVEQLADPNCYPDLQEGAEVKILQTHISVVCLAGDLVYKLKKPVRLPFVDFSTLEQRQHFCREEVRLNRRLCPLVYLGVADLMDQRGQLRFRGGDDEHAGSAPDQGAIGTIVDAAVVMRRLPADRMLDLLLQQDQVSTEEMAHLAGIMARFHGTARRGPEVEEAGAPERLCRFAMENFEETVPFLETIFHEQLHGLLLARTRADNELLLPVLEQRRRDGHVVEGHGDLHARNICMTRPVAIYDCMEFSLEFRCGDTATENAFLVMDLLYRGHRKLADAYVEAYQAASGDHDQARLMPALVRYRAMVRAKVAAFTAADQAIDEEDRQGARRSARAHLQLCATSALEQTVPLVLLTSGLPASGKSFLLSALHKASGWTLVQSDVVRKEMAGLKSTTRGGAELYLPAVTDQVYDELAKRAMRALGHGLPVLLDANYPTVMRRADLKRQLQAEVPGVQVHVLDVDIDDETAKARLLARARDVHAVSDADLRVYEKLRAEREPVTDAEPLHVHRLDGAAPVADNLDHLLCRLLRAVSDIHCV